MLVQISGQYTRVMTDPRAERSGHVDWIDPDAVPPFGAAGADEWVHGTAVTIHAQIIWPLPSIKVAD